MRLQGIVVGSILRQYPAQVCFTQNDYVVDALAPDDPISRSAKPFCQGEAEASGLSRMPHGAHSTCDDAAVEAIPIADQVARGPHPMGMLLLFGARSILRSDLP